MSAGDQLITVLINTVGAFANAFIGSIFTVFVTPFFQFIADLFSS